MSGIKDARRLLFAKETTAGVRVPTATVLWRGEAEYEDQREVVFPPEDIGLVAGADRNYVPKLLAAIRVSPTPLTFEQFPYLLAMGIKNVITGVADGGGSGYLYTYPLPVTAPTANVVKTYSPQVGDDNEARWGAYAFADSIALEGKQSEAWMMSGGLALRDLPTTYYAATTIAFVATGAHITDSANGLGFLAVGDTFIVSGSAANSTTFTVASVVSAGDITVSPAVTTESAGPSIVIRGQFTPNVAIPSVEEALFSNTKLYIDAVGGTIGTTQKSNTLLNAKLAIAKTGWAPRFNGDGNLYFSRITHTSEMEVTLEITFEHDGVASLERYYFEKQTARQIRLQTNGSVLAVAGTKYSTKALRIDLAGKWEKFSVLGEDNGNDIVTGTFRVRYNSTAALFASIEVCNLLSALP